MKNYLLSLLLFFISAVAYGQCQNPPDKIINSGIEGDGTGNLNYDVQAEGWHVAMGTPTLSWDNAPGSTGQCIWMWSYSGYGEGVFTCFSFKKGKTYTVELRVKNTNHISLGKLVLVAANGLQEFGGSSNLTAELIDSSFSHDTAWTKLSFRYVPNGDYAQLAIYPFMAHEPVNYKQYELQIDDLNVFLSQIDSTVSINPPHKFLPLNRPKENLSEIPGDDYATLSIASDTFQSALIPFNVFTPQGDEWNQDFYIEARNLHDFTIEIFNRWGQVVYSSNTVQPFWDGSYHGKPLPAGNYYYVIDSEGLDRKEYHLQGTVTMLR